MQRDGGPGGAGGAGNPTGGAFTGGSESLEIIGDHAYAYSGPHPASTTPANHLDFKTGNYYFVGRLYLNGTMEGGSASGDTTTADVKLNGTSVARLRTETSEADMPSSVFNDLIIPAYTQVEVEVDSASTNSGRKSTLVLVGRNYRG